MSLKYALLGLLSHRRASGYDLLQTFRTTLANVWPATQSQIYTELTKLADAGLLAVSEEGPRGRKEYALTEAGLAELRHWMAEIEPVAPTRDEVLLRVFFLGVLSHEQAAGFLGGIHERASASASELEELEKSVDWDDSDLSRYGRMALEWGKRMAAMRREWAAWSLEQLNDGAGPGSAGHG
jgi:DNA-binding PadR family transcriptional regulator